MTDERGAGMQIDPDLVRQLALLLDETRLSEIEVQDGDRRIKVGRTPIPAAATLAAPMFTAPAGAIAPAPAAALAPQPPASGALAPPDVSPSDHPGAIKSPMVGTAYLSAEPGAAPFVAEGKQVAAGDTLLIVEAMKVMNPIVAPRAGRVSHVFIQNGQPVEFDQPLLVIE